MCEAFAHLDPARLPTYCAQGMKIVHRCALSLMGLARARLEGYGFDGLIDALASKNVPLLLRDCNPDRLLRVRSLHDGYPQGS